MKKRLYLLWSSFKGDKSGSVVIGIMILFALICCNITTICVEKYIDSLLFFMNPNTQNAAQVLVTGDEYNADSLLSLDGTDFSFRINSYSLNLKNDESSCLYTATDELFNAANGFFSTDLCEQMTASGEEIKLIAFGQSDFEKGDTGILDNGKSFVIADVISDTTLQLVMGIVRFESFLLAYDNGGDSFSGLNAFSFPVVYEKLSDDTDFDDFISENSDEANYTIAYIEPDELMSGEFSSSFSMSIIGFTAFVASAIGILINSYLSFEKNKKDYYALSVIGARKSLFLAEYVEIKAFLLLISIAIMTPTLVIFGNVLGESYINLASVLTSIAAVAIILTICTLIYGRLLGKTVVSVGTTRVA